MDLALHVAPDGPRGQRLLEALREAILSGRIGAGVRLPSSRLLATQLKVSRGTVVAAYDELVSEGYCEARVGAGTFVAIAPPAPPPARPAGDLRLSAWARRLRPRDDDTSEADGDAFDFRSGLAREPFPATALTRALRRAAERVANSPGAGDPAGSPRLRRALVSYLGPARGLRADPSQVIVVNGSQQGIDLASRLLLDPGDRVCMENPGYPRSRAIFEALGARLVPAPVDDAGIVTGALPEDGGALLYVTPSHQYPTGGVLAPERRLQLLAWAEALGVWLLEDDYDSEFRYIGPPLPCLQGLDRAGRCIYVGSLSKLLHPALRLGYIVVPPALVPAAVEVKRAMDMATSPLIQEAVAELFESGEIARHLRRALRAYRRRRAHLVAALAGGLGPGVRVWPVSGGLHVYVEAPEIPPERFFPQARARRLLLVDAADCWLGPAGGTRLIVWFSRIPVERIAPGIQALREALAVAAAEPCAAGSSPSPVGRDSAERSGVVR